MNDNKNKLWSQEEIDFLTMNYLTMSDEEIGLAINRTKSAVCTKRKKMGLKNPNPFHKKYTFQDVIEEFNKTDYILVSDETDYINSAANTIRYICPKHRDKGEQKISLSHLQQRRGCYYCGYEKVGQYHTATIDYEENKRICESNGFIFCDTYVKNHKVYISFICPKHEELGVQETTVYNMKRGMNGCKYCSGKQLPEWYVMKKAEEVAPNIKILSKYSKLTDKLDCICTKHNVMMHKSMKNILSGLGCKECGKEKLSQNSFLSIEEVQERINKKNPHITLLEYKGYTEMSKCYCKKHDIIFYKSIHTLINNESGCSECYAERMRNTFGMGVDEFKRRLNEVHPELIVIGDYINNSTPIQLYCTKHDYYFEKTPVAALDCLVCCNRSRATYKEEQMCQLLERWGYNIIRQKSFSNCKDNRSLLFDAYIEDFNIAVEYQGEQHYYPVRFSQEQSLDDAIKRFEYTVKHDKIKKEYCKSNNIKLIEVPYWQHEDMEYYLFDQLVKAKAIEET